MESRIDLVFLHFFILEFLLRYIALGLDPSFGVRVALLICSPIATGLRALVFC